MKGINTCLTTPEAQWPGECAVKNLEKQMICHETAQSCNDEVDMNITAEDVTAAMEDPNNNHPDPKIK